MLILLVGAPLTAEAQTRPDAGALQQEIDRDRTPPVPSAGPPPPPPPPPRLHPRHGALVTVRRFKIEGASLIAPSRLESALTNFLGHPLDFSGLKAAAEAVAKTYRASGWIVRAYLPAQDIRDGVVTIQVVEGVYGRAVVSGRARRVRSGQVVAVATARLRRGRPLKATDIDRGLLLAAAIPGAAVTGGLRAGDDPRTTDLVLTVRGRPLVAGDVAVDNAGDRSTGAVRLLGGLDLASALGFGDEITLNGLYSRGLGYIGAGLNAPVGDDGLRVGFNGSYLTYRLVGADFASLGATGDSTTLSLDARYPLVRTRRQSLDITASVAQKLYDNYAAGVAVSQYQVREATVGAHGLLRDSIGGGGENTASLALTVGNLDLAGSPSQSLDSLTTRAGGEFLKFDYQLARRQRLGRGLAVIVQASGQLASRNLDSSEKFYLGGAGGVRAYPTNEGGGSSGELVDVGLEQSLPLGLRLTAFYDWGRVSVNVDDHFTGAFTPNTYSLQGAGLGLSWRSRRGLRISASYARRFGENPARSANGADQDGSLIRDRFWLTAGAAF